MNKTTLIICCITITLVLIVCNPFRKSWDRIYKAQQELFTTNRQTFQNSAIAMLNAKMTDTIVLVTDSALHLPQNLADSLAGLGVKKIEMISRSADPTCYGTELRFIPDSLWTHERFSVFFIQYNRCDERSKAGVHWKAEGSDHKHAFGMGGGWLIYSDTDRDPF